MRLVAKKRILRREIKKDLLLVGVENLIFYIRHRREIFKIGGIIAGGVILLTIFSIFILEHIKRKKEDEFLASKLAYFAKDVDYKDVAKKFQDFYKKNRSHKKAPIALFYQASCYSFVGDFKLARKLWKDFIIRYPNHILTNNAYHNIAKTYEEEGKFREAINTYKKALERYPQTYLAPYYHLAMSMYFAKLKEYEKAYKECSNIIRLYPDSAWVDNARYYAKIYKNKM